MSTLCRIVLLAAAATAASLVGCAAGSGATAGMSTRLAPGQAMTIDVGGRHGYIEVDTDGPGRVVLGNGGAAAQQIRVGSPGSVVVSVRDGESWTVRNDSDRPTPVVVRVTGMSHVRIVGPEVK